MTIQPATTQLLDLADAMRPGEGWRDPILGMLRDARAQEWTWAKFCNTVVRLLCDEAAGPRDLAQTVRSPLSKSAPADPPPEYELARAVVDASTGPIPPITEGQ
jgi:hypothetical protein